MVGLESIFRYDELQIHQGFVHWHPQQVFTLQLKHFEFVGLRQGFWVRLAEHPQNFLVILLDEVGPGKLHRHFPRHDHRVLLVQLEGCGAVRILQVFLNELLHVHNNKCEFIICF